MPRPPRIDFPDALYHVTSRGNGRDVIFWSDADRQRFLSQLADNVHTHAVVLYAYVLMDNHYHLLLRTPRSNLSRFMQRLGTAYALYARYKHRRPGHQFEGRFKAKLVQDEEYLRALTRYLHLNPIKTAACRRLDRRERLRRLDAYAWSSYPGYIDAGKRVEFVCYDLLKDYGRTLVVARRQYRAYTRACLLGDDRLILDALGASRFCIGDAAFVERTEQLLSRRRSGRAEDEDLVLPRSTVNLARIDALVAAHYGVAEEQMQAHGRRAGQAKYLAIELACRLTGLTQRAVGAHYGGISCSAVGAIRRKIREGDYPLAAALARLHKQASSAERKS
jgi:putative transposase